MGLQEHDLIMADEKLSGETLKKKKKKKKKHLPALETAWTAE